MLNNKPKMTNKFNQLLELNFATHFWLRCVWKLQTKSGVSRRNVAKSELQNLIPVID